MCERENWCIENGKLCLASTRAARPRLVAELKLALPVPRLMGGVSALSKMALRDYPERSLARGLDDLGAVSVVPVEVSEEKRLRGLDDGERHYYAFDAGCPGGRKQCGTRIWRWFLTTSGF